VNEYENENENENYEACVRMLLDMGCTFLSSFRNASKSFLSRYAKLNNVMGGISKMEHIYGRQTDHPHKTDPQYDVRVSTCECVRLCDSDMANPTHTESNRLTIDKRVGMDCTSEANWWTSRGRKDTVVEASHHSHTLPSRANFAPSSST
jgi:hypothetical protein